MSFTFDFKKLLENALRFVPDVVLNILPCTADFTRVDGPTAVLEVQRELHLSINLRVFELTFSKMILLFIILCLFIHNSRTKYSRKATAQASLKANNCFQF